jgi:hypothetical protein
MQEPVREQAGQVVDRALQHIQRLRATGPNPFDYWIWADETVQMLETLFGAGAPEPAGLAEIVYERGRTIDQRGAFDNMTLGIHGEWGIRARLSRAEAYLTALHGRAAPARSTTG